MAHSGCGVLDQLVIAVLNNLHLLLQAAEVFDHVLLVQAVKLFVCFLDTVVGPIRLFEFADHLFNEAFELSDFGEVLFDKLLSLQNGWMALENMIAVGSADIRLFRCSCFPDLAAIAQ